MFLIVPYYLILKYKTIYFNKNFMTRRVHVLAVRCDLYNASCLPHRIYFNQTILWAL